MHAHGNRLHRGSLGAQAEVRLCRGGRVRGMLYRHAGGWPAHPSIWRKREKRGGRLCSLCTVGGCTAWHWGGWCAAQQQGGGMCGLAWCAVCVTKCSVSCPATPRNRSPCGCAVIGCLRSAASARCAKLAHGPRQPSHPHCHAVRAAAAAAAAVHGRKAAPRPRAPCGAARAASRA